MHEYRTLKFRLGVSATVYTRCSGRADSETTVAVTRTAVDPRVPWINRHNDIDVVMLGTRSSLTSNGADSSNSELKTVNVGLDRPATDHDILPSIQFGGGVHLTIAAF